MLSSSTLLDVLGAAVVKVQGRDASAVEGEELREGHGTAGHGRRVEHGGAVRAVHVVDDLDLLDRRNETGNPAQEAIGGVGEVSGEGTREVEVVTQQRP